MVDVLFIRNFSGEVQQRMVHYYVNTRDHCDIFCFTLRTSAEVSQQWGNPQWSPPSHWPSLPLFLGTVLSQPSRYCDVRELSALVELVSPEHQRWWWQLMEWAILMLILQGCGGRGILCEHSIGGRVLQWEDRKKYCSGRIEKRLSTSLVESTS